MPSILERAALPPAEFKPTAEQEAILQAVRTTSDNIMVVALAGAAKTTTLELIANKALPATAMLCLAFNKRIATEMQKRLPTHCTAKTLNSVGYTAWARFLNKRFLENAESKTYRLVNQYMDEQFVSAEEKKFLYTKFSDLMQAVDSGKVAGWIPDGHFPHAKPLVNDAEFFASLPEEPTDAEKELITWVTLRSLDEAYEGLCDFNDQLLCPTVFPASFQQFPVTLVDEAQDLSPLNHVMLSKIVGKKRLIAVGDPNQSIYAFRGADEHSMAKLEKAFSTTIFPLTISFRCPQKVVEEARWRAPAMTWPTWAKEGVVRSLTTWSPDDLPDNATILCRNNAPLFAIAFKLLRAGRFPELVGADIGKSLLKVLTKLGDKKMPQVEVKEAIAAWKAAKLEKSREPGKIEDQAACLLIFAEKGDTLGDAIAYCEHILRTTGPIKLMTGHKAKGLEWDDVFILDQALIGGSQQDLNLRYVMQTRAKSTLTYITSEGWNDEAAQ